MPLDALLADCHLRRTRRSGPGGQHRNKVETAVVIEHLPSGISAEASERRSQDENRRVALFRLRLNLALLVRKPVSPAQQPSLLWRSRCQHGKISVNSRHEDFPAVLAEALDFLAAAGDELQAAAAGLNCTASQLTKLLQQEPRALVAINAARRRRGLHALK